MRQNELWHIRLDSDFRVEKMSKIANINSRIKNIDNCGNYNKNTNDLLVAVNKNEEDILWHLWWLVGNIQEDLKDGRFPQLRQLEM